VGKEERKFSNLLESYVTDKREEDWMTSESTEEVNEITTETKKREFTP